VNQDNPLVIEIWNLVFIQFNRKANGSLEELPAKHVDTGMGFERLMHGTCKGLQSNYDTDIFQSIIKELEKLSRN
jgi:alanyl-tRNA synthetase